MQDNDRLWKHKIRLCRKLRLIIKISNKKPPHQRFIVAYYNSHFIKTTRNGIEPSTSAVTGRRSNQLSHRAIKGIYIPSKPHIELLIFRISSTTFFASTPRWSFEKSSIFLMSLASPMSEVFQIRPYESKLSTVSSVILPPLFQTLLVKPSTD